MTSSVKCPTCDTTVKWIAENQHRPFCSQRCQQIDFGDWATESYSIAGEPAMDSAATNDLDEEY
ncbi:DNA gyrase inhibitor YacG [Porticoccaceae bacterium]|nr:DNA gyrase inhibitor YacG [Porticoccaceae bacterium]MDA8652285.1 DNA gyrase inhibitor YacG [Porticoccaceae bacterium]MDB2486610.1 DNA gyrase inhibitor YacG [Porticoccaceae bacterium]MDB2635152.1 DNA gyrase inhibitor YacG [Porticoccaceae bacterium]MDB2664926.1 DNA gyrase inhibitor YacG [Porticoccaceae bacterium]